MWLKGLLYGAVSRGPLERAAVWSGTSLEAPPNGKRRTSPMVKSAMEGEAELPEEVVGQVFGRGRHVGQVELPDDLFDDGVLVGVPDRLVEGLEEVEDGGGLRRGPVGGDVHR